MNANVNAPLPWYKGINKEQWSALIAGYLGWALDAFDTLLYSFTIISFMHAWNLSTGTTGLVATLSLLASSLGGIIFGIIADKIGRMKALTYSILLYALATGLCGFSQNIWQLLVLRLFVGLGLGGEWTAGATMISETWPKEHRGKALAIMQSAYAVGGMVASLIGGAIIAYFGWRVLYFVGALPALLVFYIRRNVKEPQIWLEKGAMASKSEKRDFPLIAIFKGQQLRKVLLGTLFVGLIMIASVPYGTWSSAYLATPVAKGGAGVSAINSTLMIFPTYFGMLFGYLFFGFLSDKFGRKKTFALFLLLASFFSPFQVYTAQISVFLYLLIGPIVGFFKVGTYSGLGPLLSELFPTRFRSTAVGFCYSIGRGMGALAVTVVGFYAQTFGLRNVLMATGIFFLLSFFFSFLLPETAGKELD
ncbi:MFS transporter [Desulfitobacterium chlororespirans]|uniref:Predicted arabinose efflux permease, MFS family n=1 Tax=Desulfitobacterium chlororespirans DSM 11544 TaxID=1121395 RepID=A0A1M7SGI4_9FIRM|nr:MFS transporter [Desulfitobacterium chlororespirans]SHN57550.1 Predicted arabinose efflux permease, MFS family [Desulfitobacterium chlororespirans DSM 11544]